MVECHFGGPQPFPTRLPLGNESSMGKVLIRERLDLHSANVRCQRFGLLLEIDISFNCNS